jgi:hypothetical protein
VSIVSVACPPGNVATCRNGVGMTPGWRGYSAGMADDPMSALFSSAMTAVPGGGDAGRAAGLVGLLGLLTAIVSGVGAVVVGIGAFVVVLAPLVLGLGLLPGLLPSP